MTTQSDILDVTLVGSKKIGSVRIAATIEEVYSDEVVVTEHPVETGAPVNDHAYMRPREYVIKCGWSNADYEALLGAAVVPFDDTGANSMATGTYVDAVYSQLLQIQSIRKPIDIVSTRRKYSNMLIGTISVVTDQKSGSALMLTASLKQVNIVSTQATKLPPRANQANPAATAETQNAGAKSAVPATPAPGGSVSPTSM
ncbi:phage baseplate protein [Burkholderia sp. YIM B11467]